MSNYQAEARDIETSYLEVDQFSKNDSSKSIKSIIMGLTIIAAISIAVFGYVNYQNQSEVIKTSTKFEIDPTIENFNYVSSLDNGKFVAYSTGIKNGEEIPDDFICGSDYSYSPVYGSAINNPPMAWANIPEGTTNIAISMGSIVETCCEYYTKYDWFVYNIPPNLEEIPTKFSTDVDGGEHGIQMGCSYDMDKMDECYFHYLPPCAHGSGTRDYFYTVYALKESLLPYIAKAYGESNGMPTAEELADTSEDTNVRANVLIQMAVDNDLILATSTITVSKTITDTSEDGNPEKPDNQATDQIIVPPPDKDNQVIVPPNLTP